MKTTTGRQTSGFLVQGTVSLASAPQSSLSTRALRKIGNGVFAGYVALALVSISYSALQTRRFGVAYAALRSCLAQADSACANTELERARSIRGSDVRVQLADASLAVLLHQLERAVSVELALEAQEKTGEVSLGGDARADLLLLRGDIAWAQGNVNEARDDFNSAKPLLPDVQLANLRIARVEAREQAALAHDTDELATLEHDFTDLISAATQGNHDMIELRINKAQTWVSRVMDREPRQDLYLAIDAARRASYLIEQQNRDSGLPLREPPRPPVRGSRDWSTGYSGSYDAQLAQYRDRLDRYNKDRAALEDKRSAAAAHAAATSSDAMDQAKASLTRALEAMRAQQQPLGELGSAPEAGVLFVPGSPRGYVVRQTNSAALP